MCLGKREELINHGLAGSKDEKISANGIFLQGMSTHKIVLP